MATRYYHYEQYKTIFKGTQTSPVTNTVT